MSGHDLTVDLGDRSYPILIGPDALDRFGENAGEYFPRGTASVISDRTVWGLHGKALTDTLAAANVAVEPILIEPGEAQKSFSELERVLDALLERRTERGDAVIAFGGGVAGDLAGFASAILKRGTSFIQIPTTLLAQVDSSVGGKTGINTARGKNLVGAFHQPKLVVADTRFIATLPDRERRGGYAEVLKYALIRDAGFFDWLEAKGQGVLAAEPEAVAEAVHRSAAWKARIVAEDERETGVRALLNFGHTFGHAAEAEAGYDGGVIHGEAVAWGMAAATRYSARLGLCAEDAADRLAAHLSAHGLPHSLQTLGGGPYVAERLMQRMADDKKVSGGRITLILTKGLGEAFIEPDADPGALATFLEDETKP